MKKTILGTKRKLGIGCAALVLFGAVAFAQAPPPPPILPPQELDRLVSRIALYPDSLLAQILAGATYTDEIPPASAWANQHSYLHGDALANAINEDHLPWDPSVQTLLPFPSVLDMMARDMAWTSQLGNAFMAQQQDVMDAVQRERHKAYDYGYLRTGPQIVVTPGPYIAIAAVNPGLYYVPLYDPLVVFAPPRPGIFIGGAIRFGGGITIGAAFAPWGWGHASFGWNTHTVIINNHPWARTWETRRTYVHPYTVQRYAPERRIEHHEVREHERREERR
ncbi:MAG TPA: DUF3300 domain-containing protein [Bryobacteraceae bacterium]|nr:DUF3300 domain-containing protein [Bryobacteraceae bacterium]